MSSGRGLRVLVIATRLNVGGVSRQLRILGEGFRALGADVEILAGEVGAREGELGAGDVPLRYVTGLRRRPSPLGDPLALRRLGRLVEERRPDVVHTHMSKAGVLGRVAAQRREVPVVVHTFHGHVLRGYFPSPVSRAITSVERYLARGTDALVTASEDIRDDLLGHGVGEPDRWHVVPCGFDPGLIEVRSPGEARAFLGIPRDTTTVGIVGRLVPIKGHDTFFGAMARIARRRADVHFVVAGDGDDRDRLEAEGRRLLGDRVTFVGWVEDLGTLYSALDVVVLTSVSEGTPMTLVEAQAAGRPVVSTRVGGVTSVLEHGVGGFLVPPTDEAAVAAATLELVECPERARTMGDAGRAWVRRRFSSTALAAAHLELYGRILERRRASAPR